MPVVFRLGKLLKMLVKDVVFKIKLFLRRVSHVWISVTQYVKTFLA